MDKQIERQITLVDILDSEDRWFTVQELTDLVQYSYKTICNDIEAIKVYLPSNWEIRIAKGKGVRLFRPLTNDLKDIRHILFKKTLAMSMYDILLFSSPVNLSKLAKELYVVPSSLYPILDKAKDMLKEFNLTLYTKPLEIQGDEINIRLFAIQLYLNSYGEKWPFTNYRKKEIYALIEEIERKNNIIFFNESREYLTLVIGIMIERILLKKQVIFDNKKLELIKETTFFNKLKDLKRNFKDICGITLSENELVFLTHILFKCQYEYVELELRKQEIIQNFKEKTKNIYIYTLEFIQEIEKSMDLELSTDTEFLQYVVQFWENHMNTKIQGVSRDIETTEYIKNLYPDVFKAIKNATNNMITKLNITMVNDYDISLLVIHVIALSISTFKKPIKILIIVGETVGIKRFIQEILQHTFGKRISIIQNHLKPITSSSLQQLEPDLIISTICLKDVKLPIIKVSSIPTKRELSEINLCINNIEKENALNI